MTNKQIYFMDLINIAIELELDYQELLSLIYSCDRKIKGTPLDSIALATSPLIVGYTIDWNRD